jgi:hypothetical protein
MSTFDNDPFETIIGHDGRRVRVLRDGRRRQTPMFLRDAMTPLQREIATKRARITDGNGNCDELAFSRPGYRIIVDAAARDARAAAYAEYLDDLTNAWRIKPPRV